MLDELLLLLFSRSVVSNSLQQTRLSCPSPSPGVSSNSCPLSQWCHPTILSSQPLLLLPLIIPSSKVFPKESALLIKWPKYWSFSISPSNEYWGLISFRIGSLIWEYRRLSRVFSNTTVQKHQFFYAQLSSQSNSHIHTWLLEKP